MPFEGAQFPAAGRLPHLGGPIITPRRQPLSIGRPSDGPNCTRMPLEVAQLAAADRLPHLGGPVITPCRQPLPIRRPGHRVDPIPVSDETVKLQMAQPLPVVPLETPLRVGLGLGQQSSQSRDIVALPCLLRQVQTRCIPQPPRPLSLLLGCRALALCLRVLAGL